MRSINLNHQPVIIIGAPRSGTKMLRNIISSFEDFSTWPFDEINFIWRHGHKTSESDEFPVSSLDEGKANYVRRQFNRISLINKSNYVVEKTCANSLRVEYVRQIFPEAKFIFINRDKLDVIESISRNWEQGHNKKNFLKKIIWYNTFDLFNELASITLKLIIRYFLQKKNYIYWGPKIRNYAAISLTSNSLQIAANQWHQCESIARISSKNIEDDKKIIIEYEKLVSDPVQYIKKISKFLNVKTSNNKIDEIVSSISKDNIGKAKKIFSKNQIEDLEQYIRELEIIFKTNDIK